jgi:hypothetical protein
VRDEKEMLLPLYRSEGEGEGARPRRWRGIVGRPTPLMPVGLGARRFGEEEGVRRRWECVAPSWHSGGGGGTRGGRDAAGEAGGRAGKEGEAGRRRLKTLPTGGSHLSARGRERRGRGTGGLAWAESGRAAAGKKGGEENGPREEVGWVR